MNIKQTFEDKEYLKLLKLNFKKTSSLNFENKIMHKIFNEIAHKTRVIKKLKLSIIFFFIGLALSILLTVLSMNILNASLSLINMGTGLMVLFIITTISFMLIDNFIRMIKSLI